MTTWKVCRSFYRILQAFRGDPPEGGQNSVEWYAYPFCGHFILILQLNIIKLTAELRGGTPSAIRSKKQKELPTWPCAIINRSRALTNKKRVQHRATQNRPYFDKFEAPEALDRCIRILSARSSFLAWFWSISAKSLDIDVLQTRIAWYWRAAPQIVDIEVPKSTQRSFLIRNY